MGKIVTYTPNPDGSVRLTEKQSANQERLMKEAGEVYYEDFPSLDQEFVDSADWIKNPFAFKDRVTVPVTPEAAAYFHSRGPAFQARLGAIIEAQITEARQQEQQT